MADAKLTNNLQKINKIIWGLFYRGSQSGTLDTKNKERILKAFKEVDPNINNLQGVLQFVTDHQAEINMVATVQMAGNNVVNANTLNALKRLATEAVSKEEEKKDDASVVVPPPPPPQHIVAGAAPASVAGGSEDAKLKALKEGWKKWFATKDAAFWEKTKKILHAEGGIQANELKTMFNVDSWEGLRNLFAAFHDDMMSAARSRHVNEDVVISLFDMKAQTFLKVKAPFGDVAASGVAVAADAERKRKEEEEREKAEEEKKRNDEAARRAAEEKKKSLGVAGGGVIQSLTQSDWSEINNVLHGTGHVLESVVLDKLGLNSWSEVKNLFATQRVQIQTYVSESFGVGLSVVAITLFDNDAQRFIDKMVDREEHLKGFKLPPLPSSFSATPPPPVITPPVPPMPSARPAGGSARPSIALTDKERVFLNGYLLALPNPAGVVTARQAAYQSVCTKLGIDPTAPQNEMNFCRAFIDNPPAYLRATVSAEEGSREAQTQAKQLDDSIAARQKALRARHAQLQVAAVVTPALVHAAPRLDVADAKLIKAFIDAGGVTNSIAGFNEATFRALCVKIPEINSVVTHPVSLPELTAMLARALTSLKETKDDATIQALTNDPATIAAIKSIDGTTFPTILPAPTPTPTPGASLSTNIATHPLAAPASGALFPAPCSDTSLDELAKECADEILEFWKARKAAKDASAPMMEGKDDAEKKTNADQYWTEVDEGMDDQLRSGIRGMSLDSTKVRHDLPNVMERQTFVTGTSLILPGSDTNDPGYVATKKAYYAAFAALWAKSRKFTNLPLAALMHGAPDTMPANSADAQNAAKNAMARVVQDDFNEIMANIEDLKTQGITITREPSGHCKGQVPNANPEQLYKTCTAALRSAPFPLEPGKPKTLYLNFTGSQAETEPSEYAAFAAVLKAHALVSGLNNPDLLALQAFILRKDDEFVMNGENFITAKCLGRAAHQICRLPEGERGNMLATLVRVCISGVWPADVQQQANALGKIYLELKEREKAGRIAEGSYTDLFILAISQLHNDELKKALIDLNVGITAEQFTAAEEKMKKTTHP